MSETSRTEKYTGILINTKTYRDEERKVAFT
jgi:hypothetical protein